MARFQCSIGTNSMALLFRGLINLICINTCLITISIHFQSVVNVIQKKSFNYLGFPNFKKFRTHFVRSTVYTRAIYMLSRLARLSGLNIRSGSWRNVQLRIFRCVTYVNHSLVGHTLCTHIQNVTLSLSEFYWMMLDVSGDQKFLQARASAH